MNAPVRFLTIALLALCACATAPSSATIGRREGPPFKTAFPDASVLVHTQDVQGVRETLRTVLLPQSADHHTKLKALLSGIQSIDTDHLLLLTEAVAQDTGAGSQVQIRTTLQGAEWWIRSEGKFSQTIDELLLAGAPKVSDPSPSNFGRLLSRTQDQGSLYALVELCESLGNAEDWDDGSDADFEQTLMACQVDQIREELCVTALLPRERFSTERAELALTAMSFDEGRCTILAADYARRDRLQTDAALRHVGLMSFDAGRVEALELAAPLLGPVEAKQALSLIKTARFDEGRVGILRALRTQLQFSDAEDALALVRCASFDAGRKQILETLWQETSLHLTGEELIRFVSLASFDAGRIEILNNLRKHVEAPLDAQTLRDLLETVSFDPARREVVELLETEFRQLDQQERQIVLEAFSFSAERRKAQDYLNG